MKYRVHRFQINMSKDKYKLESFLNSLKGEVVSIIPNVEPVVLSIHACVEVARTTRNVMVLSTMSYRY